MMRRFGLPVLPLIIGVILGPRIERQLRQTLQLSEGSVSGLWSEPIAVVIYVVIAILLAAAADHQAPSAPQRHRRRTPTERVLESAS